MEGKSNILRNMSIGFSKANAPLGAKASPALLLPLIGVVFILYLVIGLAMPVLPLFVHNDLGFSAFIVGIVVGGQYAVAVISRMGAGVFVDNRGVKPAVVLGLLIATASGGFYLASVLAAGHSTLSVIILMLGRFCLGVGENLVITGALCWGMVLMGPQRSGQVMAWIGTAIFGAMAVSSPLGIAVYAGYGFLGVALTAALVPLLALPLVVRLRSVAPPPHAKPSFRKMAGAVWMPGLGVALSGMGFGAIATFITLLFVSRGWGGVWIVLSALSVSFMVGRLFLGHLPDMIGGAKVAMACILVEAAGQALIWMARDPVLAVVGVTLSGLGYSLVYPALGVEALRCVPPEHRGLAMGAYTVFLDISLGASGPLLGLVAGRAGLGQVYLVGMLAALCAAAVIARMLWESRFALSDRPRCV